MTVGLPSLAHDHRRTVLIVVAVAVAEFQFHFLRTRSA